MFQRLMLAKIARAEGLSVLEAKNGQECLDQLRAHAPTLLFLDLNMPVLSGMDVLQTVRDEAMPTTVIVITADIQDTTRQRCMELGARMLLSKPPKEPEVVSALRSVLAGA